LAAQILGAFVGVAAAHLLFSEPVRPGVRQRTLGVRQRPYVRTGNHTTSRISLTIATNGPGTPVIIDVRAAADSLKTATFCDIASPFRSTNDPTDDRFRSTVVRRGWTILSPLKHSLQNRLAHGLIGSRVGFLGPWLADSAISPCTIDRDLNTVA